MANPLPHSPPAISTTEAEALKALAFDAADVPMLLVADGRVIAASEGAARSLGPSAQRTSPLGALGVDGPALAALALRCVESGAASKALLANGEVACAEPLRGDILLITLPRPAEDGLGQAASGLSAAAGMGRTLAHEVKNPLAGIRGAAQLLKADAPEESKALAQLVIDEVDRIRRLVDRVEALSETRKPARAAVNLHRVLTRVRALAETAAGDLVRFRDLYDPSLPETWGDEDQLVQVFLNLVNNAVDALTTGGASGGEIILATRYRHGAMARIGDDAIGPAPLEVTVEDDGPGVPAALKPHLFDPFVTGKPHGEGLGLALAAKLVAQHDGAVDFDSRPGRTVFRVRLPAAPAQRPEVTKGKRA